MSTNKKHQFVKTKKSVPDKVLEIAANWILDYEKQIIEIGCSNGNFTTLLEKRNVSNYIGIDMNKQKIIEAKILYPHFRFMCTDITQNVHLLRKANLVVSFYTLEYIKDDFSVLNNIPPNCKIIFSVPNSPYKAKIRYFELEGWKERFQKFINISKIITVTNPRKPDKRTFLFKGVRNEHIDKKTIYVPEHYRFDNMMERVKGNIGGGE